jgi:hypothetical protein
MGCNCKGGKEKKLNNLKSRDHLNVAFDAYRDVISQKQEYDELDQKQIFFAFYSVYPNAREGVSLQEAINSITWIQENYNGRK